ELTRSEQPQDLAHVSVLRPADVCERIVDARVLVGRVVAPGTVRRRDQDVRLAPVQRRTVELESNVSHHDNASLAAHECDTVVDDLHVATGRTDHRRVRAGTTTPCAHRLRPFLRTARARSAELDAPFSPALVRLDAEDLASGGAQQLDRQQAEQAEPDHDNTLPEAGCSASDSL